LIVYFLEEIVTKLTLVKFFRIFVIDLRIYWFDGIKKLSWSLNVKRVDEVHKTCVIESFEGES